ncbi:mycothiol synthase [Nocardioides acrostichi]|uniref:Mycothiol acetyltransferase n=1 Tax=Nocardioides acrostichi TaxID=2784339 RepID=A0A930UZE3_9ACTN|nr:mycothiol synthase [Nocardioides acrostichi]MBF4162552.1 mycothiol synthase [Nocardioides acrostichi]
MPHPDLDPITRTADLATESDGAAPLDEAALIALRRHPERVTASVDDAGFALLVRPNDTADGTATPQLAAAVVPDARRRGVGARLVADLLDRVDDTTPLQAWSHADHPAAARLAERHGFARVRELWLMRRPTAHPLPALDLPDDVRIRGYRPDDEQALLTVNAAAFAHHPEQGGMDAVDLADRMAEPWFDPTGLLIAEDAGSGALLGFHWTKQHDAATGEVYVVGVSPQTQGRGLGRRLTLAGLHHLAGRGATEVILYVESDNGPAITVYRDRLGFTLAPSDVHVMYERGPSREGRVT